MDAQPHGGNRDPDPCRGLRVRPALPSDDDHRERSRVIQWVRWRLGLLDSNRLVGLRFVNVVGSFVLGRGDVAEGAVESGRVEPGSPGQGGKLDVVDGFLRVLLAVSSVFYSAFTA